MDDRRIFERFKLGFAVSFLNGSNGKPGAGVVQNISAKGIGITIYEELLPKTSLELWLKIPEREPLYARGYVIWSRRGSDGAFCSGIHLERAVLWNFAQKIFHISRSHQQKS